MTVAPIRNLSKYGVLNDVDAYNLPPEAWSMAVNARFQDGSVVRAPVFRRVPLTLSSGGPRFLSSNFSNAGFDTIYIGYLSGHVTSYRNGVETLVSASTWSTANAEQPYTSCHLGDVFYVNRGDRVPWSLRVTDTQFQNLANWNAAWSVKILRSCNSALVAFGVTKSGTLFPTMVKTSEFAQVNTVPSTWDNTLTTTNATENILAEMEGPITDAQNLGEIMIIYGLNETWAMVPDGSKAVWDYHKLFNDAGAVNANCSVEVNKTHYVFGPTDIWKHDGNSKVSICDGQTRKFIFGSINLKQAGYFFVTHDRNRKEIRFNYVSGDRLIYFVGLLGCNRSAVYNYVNNTWTYDDLPFVFGSTTANLDTSLTWANVTSSWDVIGGSWLDQEDSLKKTVAMISEGSLYAVDAQGPGSLVAFPVDLNATRPVVLEKDGIDLDGLPELESLRGYKFVNKILPQARFEAGAVPLEFSFGSADNFNQQPVFTDFQTYDGDVFTSCDFYSGGRYLFMRVRHNDYHWFSLNALDVDVDTAGDQ